MRSYVKFVICAWLAVAPVIIIAASTQPEKQTPAPDVKARLVLDDGSIINGVILTPTIAIETAYGQLTVPIADIRTITFGLHLEAHEARAIETAAKSLGSSVFVDRDKANRALLGMGRRALPALEKLAQGNPDAEIGKRAADLAKTIVESDARPVANEDVISTARLQINGTVKLDAIVIRSAYLGDVSVKVAHLASIVAYGQLSGNYRMEAARYGSDLDKWLDTGIDLLDGCTLQISASGAVDLWPQGPGQYMVSPKGYNTAGKGGAFMAGALIARIGETKPFYVGDGYVGHTHSKEAGRLYLQIVPSPWNNPSVGAYEVQVKVKR